MKERRGWPLVVRRAQPSDAAAVLAFASRTWDDWDYLPNAWPVWLAADDGVLLVGAPAQLPDGTQPLDTEGRPLPADQAVAVARVALPAIGQAWLEGIRVDPRVRGIDVATDMQVAELHWSAALGANVVRYATSERNEGSRRLGARHGFGRQAVFLQCELADEPGADRHLPSSFAAEVRADTSRRRQALLTALASDGWAAEARDAGPLWDALTNDPTFGAGIRLYEPRAWAMQELTRADFERHVQHEEVIVSGTPRDDGVGTWAMAIFVREHQPAEDPSLRLALLAGDGRRAAALLERAHHLADEPIRFRLPDGAPLMAALRAELPGPALHVGEFRLDVLGRQLAASSLPPIDAQRLILADPPAPLVR